VADLLDDGERAAALGSAAAEHVAGYTPAAYAEAMHAVYRRASSGGRPFIRTEALMSFAD
jgi:hypothetical protein